MTILAVRAVAFDLWETLITESRETSSRQEQHRLAQLRSALEECGHGHVTDVLPDAHRRAWHTCFERYWSRDVDIPTRQQVLHLLEHAGVDPLHLGEDALARLEESYTCAALEILPEQVADAAHVLETLTSAGLKIGLISNTGRTPGSVLRTVLERVGLARWIGVMVFSNEHGACKPQRSIFDALASSLAVPPAAIAFVGDNLYVDVHGAQRAGMKGIHFAPSSRGMAVAPDVQHGLDIVPDATITNLTALLPLIGLES